MYGEQSENCIRIAFTGLWKVLFNELEATMVGFADGLAPVVVAKSIGGMALYARKTICTIKSRLKMTNQDLAVE